MIEEKTVCHTQYFITFVNIENNVKQTIRYSPYVTEEELQELKQGLNIIASAIINQDKTNLFISFTENKGTNEKPELRRTTLVLTNVIGFQTDINLTSPKVTLDETGVY